MFIALVFFALFKIVESGSTRTIIILSLKKKMRILSRIFSTSTYLSTKFFKNVELDSQQMYFIEISNNIYSGPVHTFRVSILFLEQFESVEIIFVERSRTFIRTWEKKNGCVWWTRAQRVKKSVQKKDVECGVKRFEIPNGKMFWKFQNGKKHISYFVYILWPCRAIWPAGLSRFRSISYHTFTKTKCCCDRSERECKALRGEAEDLKEKLAALRTRLACVQGRRHAEQELAAKNAEVGTAGCCM